MRRELIEDVIRGAAEVLAPTDLAGCLDAMQRIVSASQSLLFTFSADGQPTPLAGCIAPLLRETYAPYYAQQDPLQHGLRASGAPFTILQQRGAFDVVSSDVYRESIAYNEVHAPHGLEHQFLVFPSGVPYGEPGMIGFLFTRNRRQDPFVEEDIHRMLALEPSLRAAARRTQRLGALERERDALSALLALDVEEPRAVFSDEHGLRWMNEPAARAFSRFPGLRVRIDAQARALRLGLERPLDADLPTRLHVVVGPGACATGELHVVRDEWHRPLIVCRFRLVLEEPAEPGGEIVRLTSTEKIVLYFIMRGFANKEIATHLGVSPETVRTHVKSLFRKLNVNTRVQAAMWGRKHLPSLVDELGNQ